MRRTISGVLLRGAVLGLVAILGSGLAASADTLGSPSDRGHLAYVGTAGGDAVTVIDMSTDTVVTTITAGAGPAHLVATRDGRRVYTANAGGNSVSVVDVATDTVVRTIPVGGSPGCLAYDGRTNRLYVANSADATISVINTRANRVVATIAVPGTVSCVAVHPNGRTLYVSGAQPDGTGVISIIDARTTRIIRTVPGTWTVSGETGIVVHPDGTKLYAGAYRALNVFDTRASLLESLPWGTTGDSPLTFAFTPDHRYLYVGGVRGYQVLDTTTDTFPDEAIPFSPPPNPVTCLGITPDGKDLVHCNSRRQTVTITDIVAGTDVASLSVPSPSGVAIA